MPGALPDRMQSLFYVADLSFDPLFLFLLASFDARKARVFFLHHNDRCIFLFTCRHNHPGKIRITL